MFTKPAQIGALGLVLLVSALLPISAAAQATVSTVTFTQPVGMIYQSPCTGELVETLEEWHFVVHVTETPNGDVFTFSQSTSRGATGTGLTSGATYQIINLVTFRDDLTFPPLAATFTNQQHYIRRGGGDHFVVTLTLHATYDANGVLRAEVGRVESECR